ncbi:MAG TPA: GspH/FimT family pseudopilin [Kofleriaceae bacterium]|jgi:prepilin-type N-terminal cleavage/methylation domain-containing protein
MKRHAQRGFTLIELMVVVLIIGVVSALLVGLNSQTYGASAMSVSDELVSALNLCKMRAVSTRTWHRCEVTPTTLTINQWSSTGMTVPTTMTGTWSTVEVVTLGAGVSIWDKLATPCATSPCSGAPTVPNTTLLFDIDFRPDGSSTGGTLFVTDPGQNKMYRVVVYTATGSSYARNSW